MTGARLLTDVRKTAILTINKLTINTAVAEFAEA